MPGVTTDPTWSKEEDLAIMVQADERGAREWVKVRRWLVVCFVYCCCCCCCSVAVVAVVGSDAVVLPMLTEPEPEPELKNAS